MAEQREAEESVLMDVEAAVAGSERAKMPVDRTFRRYGQDQPMLLAPDIRDWPPADGEDLDLRLRPRDHATRSLERRCHDDIALAFLTAQQPPDFARDQPVADPPTRSPGS